MGKFKLDLSSDEAESIDTSGSSNEDESNHEDYPLGSEKASKILKGLMEDLWRMHDRLRKKKRKIVRLKLELDKARAMSRK